MSSEVESSQGLWSSLREAVSGSHGRDFTKGSIDRAIFMLSVPMVLEMCMESLFGIVDIFFVAKLGKEAMAAAALTESTLTLLFAVAMGLSMGTTAIIARRIGEKNYEDAGVAAAQSLIAGTAISVVIGIVGAWQAPNLLRAMGAEPEVVRVGTTYTRTIYGGSATIFLLFLLNAVFRGSGDAAVAMRSLWLANGINILLNPVLIFGLGPFPELGVAGSAVGTTIGRGCGVLYQLFILFSGNGRVSLRWRDMRLVPEVMRKLIALSLGGMFQYIVPMGSWTFLIRMAASFGTAAVAGYALAVRIIIFLILPSWGMSNAAATLVGQNLGAGEPQRAEASAWRAGFFNMLFLGSVGVGFLIWAPELVALFVSDPEVISVAAAALRIFSAGNVFYAYGMVMTQAFNGAGDTYTPTMINLLCYWVFQIPLAAALAFPLAIGFNGIFYAVPAAEFALAALSIWMFRKGKWKSQKV
jgi:putative MATE family efflux protein